MELRKAVKRMKTIRGKIIAGFMGVLLIVLTLLGILMWQNERQNTLVNHDLVQALEKADAAKTLAQLVVLADDRGAWASMTSNVKAYGEAKALYDKTVAQVADAANQLQTNQLSAQEDTALGVFRQQWQIYLQRNNQCFQDIIPGDQGSLIKEQTMYTEVPFDSVVKP